MRIVLLGEDHFTAAVLQSLRDHGHEIAVVICPLYPGNQEYRTLEKRTRDNGIGFLHVADVNTDEIADLLLRIDADLLLSVHCRKILHPKIFRLSRCGAVNVHPSLLPKYRGLSPQHQTLIHGDTETGVTIHFIDSGVDTGDILITETIPISPQTYIYELQIKMLTVYKYLVPNAMKLIETGNPTTRPQEKGGSSWYGALTHRDREIDLKKTKFENYNLIRAVSKPYKGAWHDNTTIWTAVIADPAAEQELLKEFNTIGIFPVQDKLVIRLHDGILLSDDFEIAST